MMRVPVIPTLVVAAAVATMTALGIWQLRRADEKAALLAQFEAKRDLPPVDLRTVLLTPGFGFRKAFVECRPGAEILSGAGGGRSADGQPGWIFKTDCEAERLAPDHTSLIQVVAGWSADPKEKPPVVINERVTGILIERDSADPDYPRYLLFPDRPLAGLKLAEPPSTASISNNHLLYAAQWFFFALAAAVIYVLALRRRHHTP